MRYIVFIMFFFLVGCSSQDKNILLNTGEKPPTFFRFTKIESMNDYVFDTKKFSLKFPLAKEIDFMKMGGWSAESMRDGHTVALSLENSIVYSIVISTNYKPLIYNDRHKAIENEDIVYINYIYHQYHPNKDILLQRHGKENYLCQIREGVIDKHIYPNKKEISFECYKFNSRHTRVKSVALVLTYNDINSSIYTYEDLLKRGQRVLDSLYIKDGWDE